MMSDQVDGEDPIDAFQRCVEAALCGDDDAIMRDTHITSTASVLLTAARSASLREVYLATMERVSHADVIASPQNVYLLLNTITQAATELPIDTPRLASVLLSLAKDVPALILRAFLCKDGSPVMQSVDMMKTTEESEEERAEECGDNVREASWGLLLPSLSGLVCRIVEMADHDSNSSSPILKISPQTALSVAFELFLRILEVGSGVYSETVDVVEFKGIFGWFPEQLRNQVVTLFEIFCRRFDVNVVLQNYGQLKKVRELTARGEGGDYDSSNDSDDDDIDNTAAEALFNLIQPPLLQHSHPGLLLFTEASLTTQTSPLSSAYILQKAIPYVITTLSSTSSVLVACALRFVEFYVNKIPNFSLSLEENECTVEETTRKQDMGGEEGKSVLEEVEVSGFKERFADVFALLKGVSQVMVQNPLQKLRTSGLRILQGLLRLLKERTRFKMYLALIRSCPFQSVASLVITMLKDEMREEYAIVNDSSQAVEIKRQSAFLQKDVVVFFTRYLGDCLASLRTSSEAVAGVLSLLLFVMLKERQHRWLALGGNEVQALKTVLSSHATVLEDPSAALPFEAMQMQTPTTVQCGPMLCFSIDRLREVLDAYQV